MEELGRLFFELASENRLTILRLLCDESLRMQEVARRLDVTATEAFRQLQRLGEVSLVERRPDGAFTATQYGRLVMHLSSVYGFVSQHREYFLGHDVWGLPTEFLNRLGELSGAELLTDSAEGVNTGIRIFLEAEEYAWGVSERGSGGPDHLDPLVDDQISRGVRMRLIVPVHQLSYAASQVTDSNVEVRGLSEPPALVALSEREAMACFRFVGGRMDYAGFTGRDPIFRGWARDLFQHYWERSQ